jgi:hypothetical protein
MAMTEPVRKCLQEMRTFAKSQTVDLKCPVMRLLQIEEHLAKHLEKQG